MNFWTLHIVAFVIRLILVGFGIYQDKTMVVKYTDIDFHVFTDACRFVAQVRILCRRSDGLSTADGRSLKPPYSSIFGNFAFL